MEAGGAMAEVGLLPFARFAAPKAQASSRCRGRHGLGAGSGEHVLCAAHASSRAKTAAVAALAEVGGGRGFGSAVRVVATRAARSVERLCEFAGGRRSCFPANPHRAGAGGRGIRQRAQSHLHPPTARSAKRDSRQTRKEDLARARSARRDAAGLSATALPPSIPDREPVLFRQTKTLGSRTGSIAAHADAASPAARIEFQSVSVETSPPFLEDVNRAKLFIQISGTSRPLLWLSENRWPQPEWKNIERAGRYLFYVTSSLIFPRHPPET